MGAPLRSVGLTQASSVSWLVKWRLGASGISTQELPSKLNAFRTSPDPYAGFPINVPSLPSVMSSAPPSPGHQLTRPEGAAVQGHLPKLPALYMRAISVDL